MWKDYTVGNIKNNRASSMSIMVGVLIAALLLSFLCSLFYNFWLDNIAGLIAEDGDWHSRIVGEITEEGLASINNFANVESAEINQELSGEKGTVVDIRFQNVRAILNDMSLILNNLGLEEDAATYNYQLLSMYFVRIPGDDAPRLLMPAYLFVVLLVCFSLILVMRTSFAVSMDNRIHQFGIFSSIGATPKQIRTCLIQEAFLLALIPALLGMILGIGLTVATLAGMNLLADSIVGARRAVFQYHPAIFAITFLISALTVLISAWLPARKLSKLTALEAIRGTGELQLKRRKRSGILSALFGLEGELAGNALKARKKALRTTALSLTLAFLGFMLIQCFFTLSGISTDQTYFARYQDVWDVMVTVKDTGIAEFSPVREIREMPGVRNGVIYQKAKAISVVPKEAISDELMSLGGLEAVAGSAVSSNDDAFLINAPIVVMDDDSFAEYCVQIGIEPKVDGGILVNRIWDSVNSVYRNKAFIPFVTETEKAAVLQSVDKQEMPVEIPVLAYSSEVPVLREEYDNYALVHFVPLSLWKEIAGRIGGAEADTYIRLLGQENATLGEITAVEKRTADLLGKDYAIESENRIQEKITNDEMISGYELILGGFCVLIAIIGIANVFSNTLGFLRQRRREFARYMSVGMTADGLRKMFFIEAMAVAGRPLLIALLLTIVATAFMIKMSYLEPRIFIAKAPYIPILAFLLVVFAFVALAYYLGGRKVLKLNLVDALRDDTLL